MRLLHRVCHATEKDGVAAGDYYYYRGTADQREAGWEGEECFWNDTIEI